MSPTDLLTLEEVAATLRVSPRTVRREIAEGHIRVIKIRRRPLVQDSELEAYIAASRRLG